MFQKGTKGHAIYVMVEAVLLLVLGILAIVFRANYDAYAVVFIIAGVFITLAAALGLTFHVIFAAKSPADHRFFNAVTGSLVSNALELTLGITLIIAGAELTGNGGSASAGIFAALNFAALFGGIVLIVYGAVYAIYATAYIVRAAADAKKAAILPYVIAVLAITAGILLLVLVWNSTSLMEILFVMVGIACIAISALLLVVGILELVGKAPSSGSSK
ncbi:MAG: hypothetical protein K6B65_00225 [Bacilli bacterium]|nr:hypothetical protein [Bacilli bacterium]